MSTPYVKQAAAKSAQAAAKSIKGPYACVRCKSMKRGAIPCREQHLVQEYPPTPLTQQMCVELMKLRTHKFPQWGVLADQRFLEAAMWAGGKQGGAANVAEAMDRLRAIDVDAYLKQHAINVDAPTTPAE